MKLLSVIGLAWGLVASILLFAIFLRVFLGGPLLVYESNPTIIWVETWVMMPFMFVCLITLLVEVTKNEHS
jgi:hypothetical protein